MFISRVQPLSRIDGLPCHSLFTRSGEPETSARDEQHEWADDVRDTHRRLRVRRARAAAPPQPAERSERCAVRRRLHGRSGGRGRAVARSRGTRHAARYPGRIHARASPSTTPRPCWQRSDGLQSASRGGEPSPEQPRRRANGRHAATTRSPKPLRLTPLRRGLMMLGGARATDALPPHRWTTRRCGGRSPRRSGR